MGVFGFWNAAAAAAGLLDGAIDLGATTLAALAGGIVGWLVQTIGWMLLNFIWVLLAVGNYNQFLASTAVTTGWVVVRDFVNMFFVLVLLAIAIGTILQQQNYHYSQTLPKFLAAAILVNFSKTICGIAIDAAQVVMMTFMGAISAAGGGNFAVLIGLHGLLKTVGERADPFSGTAAATGMLLAFFYVVVAFIVVVIMVVMLVIRIVALWFLIILSPAAFFLMSLPNDRGYFSKWLDQFINYLLLGPVMAFFLWLSLTVVAANQEGVTDGSQIYIASELGLELADKPKWAGEVQFGALGSSMIGTLGGTAGYLLGIGMLLGSLMAAQQLASVGGNVAGAGAAFAKDWMAGKRGPFSPFRGARERIAAYQKIKRQAHEEKVARQAGRIADVVGVAQKLPGGAARMGVRQAMQWGPLQQAETWVRQQSAPLRNRWDNFTTTTKEDNQRLAIRRREQAAVAFETAKEFEDAGMWDDAAEARAEGRRSINEAEGLEASVIGKSLTAAAPRVGLEIGKAFLASQVGMAGMEGALGGIATTSAMGGIYGPGIITDIQRAGEQRTLASSAAYGRAMSAHIGQAEREDSDVALAVADGTTTGYTNVERAARMRVLARRPAPGSAAAIAAIAADPTAVNRLGYADADLPARMQEYMRLTNATAAEMEGWRNDVERRGTLRRVATLDDVVANLNKP